MNRCLRFSKTTGSLLSLGLFLLVLQGCQKPFIEISVDATAQACEKGTGIPPDGPPTGPCADISWVNKSATGFWHQETPDQGQTGHVVTSSENLICGSGSRKCRFENRGCPGGKKCTSTYKNDGTCACLCGNT